MKAIQIKYIACTNTKPARLKAWAEGAGQITESYNHASGVEAHARDLANRYITEKNWGKMVGWRCLPNGDYVAKLGE